TRSVSEGVDSQSVVSRAASAPGRCDGATITNQMPCPGADAARFAKRTPTLSRREWLFLSSLGMASATLQSALLAQPAEKAAQTPTPLNRFPRMMQDYFSARVAAPQKLAELRQAKPTTKAEAEAHVKSLRELIPRASVRSPSGHL